MLTPDDVHDVAFSKPPIGKRGYNQEEVDEFLDLLESTLRGSGAHVTAEQVRAVAFNKPPIGKRGYHEDEVDAFLDRAEAHLAGRPAPPPRPTPPPLPTPPPDPRSAETPPGMIAPKKRWWQR